MDWWSSCLVKVYLPNPSFPLDLFHQTNHTCSVVQLYNCTSAKSNQVSIGLSFLRFLYCFSCYHPLPHLFSLALPLFISYLPAVHMLYICCNSPLLQSCVCVDLVG